MTIETAAKSAKGARCETCGILMSKHASNRYSHDIAVWQAEAFAQGFIPSDLMGGGTSSLKLLGVAVHMGKSTTVGGWLNYVHADELKEKLWSATRDDAERMATIKAAAEHFCNERRTAHYEPGIDESMCAAAAVYFEAVALLDVAADTAKGMAMPVSIGHRMLEARLATTLWLAAYYGELGIPASERIGSDTYACRAFLADKSGRTLEYVIRSAGGRNGERCTARIATSTGRYKDGSSSISFGRSETVLDEGF